MSICFDIRSYCYWLFLTNLRLNIIYDKIYIDWNIWSNMKKNRCVHASGYKHKFTYFFLDFFLFWWYRKLNAFRLLFYWEHWSSFKSLWQKYPIYEQNGLLVFFFHGIFEDKISFLRLLSLELKWLCWNYQSYLNHTRWLKNEMDCKCDD